MQIMQSIKKVTEDDWEWIAEKGMEAFKKVYKTELSKKWLVNLLKKCEVYTLGKSGFVSFVIEAEGILVNGWYAEGQGLKLWEWLEDLSFETKMPLIGFLHKVEEKFKRFLEKRGYKIMDFNEEVYFVEGICHQ